MLHIYGAGLRCRSNSLIVGLYAIALVAVAWSVIDDDTRTPEGNSRKLVEAYGLTDLALFTEARYLRHLSQADLHSAFQDHPGSLDHFPGGSLVTPPQHLRSGGEQP